MRRESYGEVLDKPTTPLEPIGKRGTPARIVEIPDNVTVVESMPHFLNTQKIEFLLFKTNLPY